MEPHVHVCLFFTGELIGVGYLLSRTGQPLKLNRDSEEIEDMLEDVGEEEEDEGFEDAQTPDITVSNLLNDASFSVSSLPASSLAAASSQPASSLGDASSLALCSMGDASSLAAASSQTGPSWAVASSQPASFQAAGTLPQPGVSLALDSATPDKSGVCNIKKENKVENKKDITLSALYFHFTDLKCCCSSLFVFQAVDASGMLGMDRVDRLAEYLVELRNQSSPVLTNQQVRNIFLSCYIIFLPC